MNDPDPKAVATVALVAVRLHTDADVTLKGRAIAEFTLPKEQIGGRGFAVQLYHEQENKHKRTDTFFGSYGKSSLNGNTLRFELDVPELPVKKGEIWMLVLYGDELPQASPSSSAAASPSTSAAASPSPGSSASAAPASSITTPTPPSPPTSPSPPVR